MRWVKVGTGLLAAAALLLSGCGDPPVPPEVQLAYSQAQDLRRAGAVVLAEPEYQGYLDALQAGGELLAREQKRFSWWRDYRPVTAAFRAVLQRGRQVQAAVGRCRSEQAVLAADRRERLARRVGMLRDLVGRVKDRRLSRRSLVAAELSLEEARRLAAAGRQAEAQEKMEAAEQELARVATAIRPLLVRYAEPQQLARWRRLAAEAIAASRRSGGYAIVVRKLERELVLYRAGTAVCTYPVGLGFNYLTDKLRAGDQATPEGSYRVIRRLAASRYYRALLIDYPNDEDRRRFQQARRRGEIPAGAGIGSLIEIHGGGKDGMTNGCIALENPQMQELFERVAEGTPVVIVGTLDDGNIAAKVLPWLK